MTDIYDPEMPIIIIIEKKKKKISKLKLILLFMICSKSDYRIGYLYSTVAWAFENMSGRLTWLNVLNTTRGNHVGLKTLL